MQTKLLAVFAVLTMFLLASCSAVTTKKPIGLESYAISGKDWNGTWVCEDVPITMLVKDEAQGVVQAAWVEEKLGTLKFESITFKIMKGRKWLYANVLEESDEKAGPYYFWVKLAKSDKKIILWHPSVEAFRHAAAAGKIRAELSDTDTTQSMKIGGGDTVHLLDPPEVIIDLLEAGGSTFFAWDDPMILTRMAK
jgi:hypothetical protein